MLCSPLAFLVPEALGQTFMLVLSKHKTSL
nr:MAG TPA: Phenol hydroxylase conserved region [Caudoviricetes sp.]